MANIPQWSCEEIQDRTLRPASDKRFFDLHLSALDWSLVEPIIINDPTDIKSVNWKDRGLTPFTHQVQNLITFCKRLPVALIADDVGLGKTISAGLILSELISRRRVNRVLIVCPKIVAPQWVSELDEKFGLLAKEVSGADLDTEIRRSTPIVVTTYHSASNRLAKIREGTFDLCILDEAHKLRNLYGNQKPPKMALNVKQALERRPFKYVLMLTATPIQNKIWDLYSLLDLLKAAEGKPNPLGTPAEFSRNFLYPGTEGRKLFPDKAAIFQKIVRPNLTRTRRSDVKLKFPNRKIQLLRVNLSGAELELIRVVGRLIENLPPLLQISIAQAMMSSPRALVVQAQNMLGKGSLSYSVVEEIRNLSRRVPEPAKFQQLLSVIEDLQGKIPNDWRLVVFTVRRETQEMIGEILDKKGISIGFIRGADHAENNRTIDNYKQIHPKINVIISTDAGAEGINLQAGNVLINYDLPWNPMIVEQRIGRIQRLGSDFQNVVIMNLVGAGTVEDRIVGRLTEKLQGISQAIGDIEGILDAADMEPDGDEGSFENRIRKMVVDSLCGRDVTQAQKLFEENIQDAKDLFEENRLELDQQLGGDPNTAEEVLKPPKIERRPPSSSAKDFVLNAKRAMGFEIREVDTTLYEATKKGTILEKISFEDDLFIGNQSAVFSEQPIKSFLPGKPQFERLVQHWVDHNAHHVIDKSASAKDQATIMAQQWCQKGVGMEFVKADFTPTKPNFTGTVHIRVKAGTGVDSYEKILKGKLNIPPGHGQIRQTPMDKLLPGDLQLSGVMSTQFKEPIQTAVENDSDVQKFCNFYLSRLSESLKQADADPFKRAKVESDFRPFVQADVLGIEGIRYEEGDIAIHYKIDGLPFTTSISAIPASGVVLGEPDLVTCEASGFRVPGKHMGKCASTGKSVLHHRMIAVEGGRYALSDQVIQCAVTGHTVLKSESYQAADGTFAKRECFQPCHFTGEKLLASEGAHSEYSGLFGRKSRLICSGISGRSGFAEEFVECTATGRKMFPDEGVKAKGTGLWYAMDQLVKSAFSQRLTAPTDLFRCEITGDLVSSDEVGTCSISGKRVLLSRLVACVVSGKTVLDTETAKSDFSGKVALKQYFVFSEKDPNRRGLKTEAVVCAISGKTLLLDEVSPSQVSGQYADKELLVKSDRSSTYGLPSEFETCQESGRLLLPEEMGKCVLTGKRVDFDLLEGVKDSGTFALKRLIEVCPISGKRGLPGDFGVCEITAIRVHRDALGVCSLTGKRVRVELLANRPLSGARFLPEYGIKTTDGRAALPEDVQKCDHSGEIGFKSEFGICQASGKAVLAKFLHRTDDGHRALPEEIGTCAWDEKTTLKKLLVLCKYTENWISQKNANQDQQLGVLRDLLDGKILGEPVSKDLMDKITPVLPMNALKIAKATRVYSQNRPTYAIVFQEKAGWFSSKINVCGCVLKSGNDGEFLLGKYVSGVRYPNFIEI